MADSIFGAIAETLIRGKDRALSELVRRMVNRLPLARYGEITDLRVDSLAKEIRAVLRLKGETEPIEARVTYRIERGGEQSFLIAERILVSREWVNLLLNDMAQSRGLRLELTPGAALTAKILGL